MDVWMDNEGQRTAPPAEMLRSGEYLIPTINGETYLNKPPLLYWAIAGMYALTGTTDPWAARFPTALSAVLLAVALYGLGRGHLGETAARWGSLLMLSAPYFLQRARWAELDVPLVLFTFCAIMMLYKATLVEGRAAAIRRVLVGGAALAAAVLLKGPVPFLFLWTGFIATLAVHGKPKSTVLHVCAFATLLAFGYQCAVELSAWANPVFRPVAEKPIGLVFVVAVWSIGLLGWAQERRGRVMAVWMGGALAGVLGAAPWGIGVVMAKGWPFIQSLLDEQVVERVSVASEINSGFAWYYVSYLPLLCAPWGLLFLLHPLPSLWRSSPMGYRFVIVTGWLSVVVFSLIAGKEYEYILPAFPFLLLANGCLLAGVSLKRSIPFVENTVKIASQVLILALPPVAVAGTVYTAVEFGHPLLTLEMTVIALVCCAVAWRAWTVPVLRIQSAYILGILISVAALVSQSFHYTGDESPKAIAQLAGRLARAGYVVETTKAYPAVAYYAATRIPEVKSAEVVKEKLSGPDPYYCLTRNEYLPAIKQYLPPDIRNPLAGPVGFKGLILVGNASVPELEEVSNQ